MTHMSDLTSEFRENSIDRSSISNYDGGFVSTVALFTYGYLRFSLISLVKFDIFHK